MKLLPNHIRALLEIARRGGRIRSMELSRALGSTSSTYTSLQKLMLEGLVTKEGKEYVLTDKGWRFLLEVRNELLRIVNEIPIPVKA